MTKLSRFQDGAENSVVRPGMTGSLADFRELKGSGIIDRTEPFFQWQQSRAKNRLWPYSRSLDTAPSTRCMLRDATGINSYGINFASQDYLSLSQHSEVVEAAIEALRDFGVHSAGSAVLIGNTRYSVELERKLSEHLRMEYVLLFPTGWGAGYGSITGLVRQSDYVILDVLTHACLQSGALAATPNVLKFAHNNLDHLEMILKSIRAKDADNAIMVVTEGLFSMDSDIPDIGAVQSVCHAFDACLMLDVAHDFGSMGVDGLGSLGSQEMLGQVDIVMGSFSKTFASNGGFVACRSQAVFEYLRCFSSPHTFSNALSPVQAATVNKACELVFGSEGEVRRDKLAKNIKALRSGLTEQNLQCIGTDSPIVPVLIGREDQARLISGMLAERGLLANLVEYPAVPPNRARFRFQVMADHSQQDATEAAVLIGTAVRETLDT